MSARAGGYRACGWRRAIVTLPHVIGRQVIEIEVASDRGTLDLLDRIGEINRARFIPVIARVLNEFERPGVVIAIDRIDLRLGTVPDVRPDTLAERLESALREALGEALSTGAAWPSNSGHANATRATDAMPVGAALLRSLTRYLLHGVWPYRQDAAGYPMALLAGLIDHEPAALLQMIRRYRGHPEFIERIALQTAFADLERLLNLIEPKDAATILAAMKKFRDVHRVARVRDISQIRQLWRLVLQRVLNGTGGGFDPAGFEQQLLQGISATQTSGAPTRSHAAAGEMPAGFDFPRRIAPAHAQSGPAAADVQMPQDIRPNSEPAPLDLLELFLLQGAWPGGSPDALLIRLAAEQPDALARLFRHHAHNEAMLHRVTKILSPVALRRLLTLLTPEAAAIIVTHMLEVRGLHRAKPVLPLSDQSLERLLWFVALRFVLNQAGSQFNRRSFVRSLIEGIANAERLTYRELLAALHSGVAEVAKAGPVATSLPAIILELARSLEPADRLHNPVPESQQAAARSDGAPEALATPLKSWRNESRAARDRVEQERSTEPAAMPSEPERWDPDQGTNRQTAADLAGPVAEYEHLDRLRHLLVTGVLPWRDILAEPQLTPQRLIEALERLRPGLVRTALNNAPLHRPDVRRALDAMPDAAIVNLIRLLLPRNAGDRELTQSIISYSARAANRRNFQAMLIIALVEGSALDFEALAAASDRASGQASAEFASAFLAETLLAALADGVGGGNATEPQWTETLLRLLASNVRAARRFISAVAKSPAALTRMAHLCGPALLDRILVVVAPAAGVALTAFARATIAEGARHGMRRSDIVAAFLAELATIDADAAPSAGLFLRIRRRLFGTTMPPWFAPMLRRDLLPHLSPGVATTLSAMLTASGWQDGLMEAPSAEPRGSLPPQYGRRDAENVSQNPAFGLQPSEPDDARNDAAATEALPGQHAERLLGALAQSDLSRATARDEVPELLRELMNELLETSNRELATRLVTFLSQARNGPHLIRLLPERQLAQLMMIAAPHTGRSLLQAGEALAGVVGAGAHNDAAATEALPGQHAERLFRALAQSDLSRAAAHDEVPELLRELINELLETSNRELAIRLVAFLSQARNGPHLIRLLPERQLAQLMIAAPHTGPNLLEAGEALAGAAGDDARNDAAATEALPGQHAEWLFRALAQSDLSRAAARDEVPELLRELINELLETPNRELAIRLVAFLSQARNGPHLIRLLPERQLAQLMMIAAPHTGRSLLEAGEVLAGAVGAAGHAMDRSTLWQALFDTVVAPIGERTVVRLSERVLAIAGRASSDPDPAQKDAAAASLLQALARHARDAGLAALAAAVEQQRGGLIAAYVGERHPAAVPITARGKSPHRAIRARTAFGMAAEDDEIRREPIYIGNAGLVLANPFLPQLFDAFGLLGRNEAGKPRLRDEAAATRAVHLLQYLVDGRTDRPEPLLALNKIMCGMPIAAPVEREIEATDFERETCDALLRSIVENWPILRNTSIAGLRETFLQREGKLTYGEVGWRLQVQRKTLDILVDQVPWSIGVVFHAWMPAALHVTW
jgi:hypothetical protein